MNSVYVFLYFHAGAKVNGEWKMMSYRSYYENVRLAAKGFIKVKENYKNLFSFVHYKL